MEQWNLHLKLLLGTLTWYPDLEPRKLFKPLLYLEPLLELRSLPKPIWNFGTLTWNHRTLKLFGTFTWNPYLEPRNLLELLRGTLTWHFGAFRNLTFTWKLPSGTFTWNSRTFAWNFQTCLILDLEPWNLPEPSLETLEPPGSFTWNPYLEPRNLLEPLLGTL